MRARPDATYTEPRLDRPNVAPVGPDYCGDAVSRGTYVAVLELGWAPAVDGLADVLLGADDDREDDEDDGGVQVVQPVDPVVVIATLQTRVRRETAQYAVKPVAGRRKKSGVGGRERVNDGVTVWVT